MGDAVEDCGRQSLHPLLLLYWNSFYTDEGMAKIFSSTNSVFVTILAALVFFGIPHESRAAVFQVVPMLQEVTLAKEAEKEIEVTLINTTGAAGTFQLKVYDFGSLDESGGVAFLGAGQDLDRQYSLASWMQPEKETISLLPDQREVIKVRIKNENTLAPGGHYAALVFEMIESSSPDIPNTIAVKEMIASLVFLKKTGGEQTALQLMSIEQERKPYFFDRSLYVRFHNPGNVHVVPRGVIEVMDPFHRLVYRGVINESSVLVLPNTFRRLVVNLFSVASAWIPGRYSLVVKYRFDGNDEWQEHKEMFFLWPPKTTLGVVLGGIAGMAILYGRRRRGKKLSPGV